jgi:hypothetical protein
VTDFPDIDPIGDIADSARPTDETGWAKDPVYYGDQSPDDDAVSSGYLAPYSKGNRRIDLLYYVTRAANDDDRFEVQLRATTCVVDDDEQPIDGTEEFDYSYPFDFAADDYATALRWARNAALGDERFKLGD